MLEQGRCDSGSSSCLSWGVGIWTTGDPMGLSSAFATGICTTGDSIQVAISKPPPLGGRRSGMVQIASPFSGVSQVLPDHLTSPSGGVLPLRYRYDQDFRTNFFPEWNK